jgi:hypothetical protein
MVAAAHASSPNYYTAPPPQPADWSIGHVGFRDVLSAINPLQYLPVVGMIYREATGDTVPPAFRIGVSAVASMLFGGPIGLAVTMIGAAVMEVADGHALAADDGRVAEAGRAYDRISRLV